MRLIARPRLDQSALRYNRVTMSANENPIFVASPSQPDRTAFLKISNRQ